MTFTTLVVAIFFIMNPIGDVPTFISVLAPFPAKKQRRIIIREILVGLGVLILFALWGEKVLHFMNISTTTVMISGGIILFMIAIHMIFPTPSPEDEKKEAPFIVPLAIPIIAGPGVMSALIIYSHQMQDKVELLLALLVAWALSSCVYMSASIIKKVLGNKGSNALEKLGGIILTMISVQMLSDGIVKILK